MKNKGQGMLNVVGEGGGQGIDFKENVELIREQCLAEREVKGNCAPDEPRVLCHARPINAVPMADRSPT